jgi:hypothetical protein
MPPTSGQLAIEEVSPEVPTPLNNEERIRLDQLENVIAGSIQSFLVVGRCLLEVRDRKLYREHYPDFKTYCIKRWGISERRGLDLARSTAVAEVLLAGPAGPDGDSPLPADLAENVMRPLSKLRPELQAECWRLASRISEKPTHFVITRIVRLVIDAIDQGCDSNGGGQPKPKRSEPEETSYLRTVFLLARTPFPAAELFAIHFGEDQEQAARAWLACRQLERRCETICAALLQRFPELEDKCNQRAQPIVIIA